MRVRFIFLNVFFDLIRVDFMEIKISSCVIFICSRKFCFDFISLFFKIKKKREKEEESCYWEVFVGEV